jgi:AraC family transcriptional regulator, transcriptional activator of pobA
MDAVKTYEVVNKADSSLSFGISKMEEIYLKHKGKPDEPHRHDYFTVLIVQTAKGKHFIDFSEYALADNQIFFISPGQVHQVIEEQASVGFSMVFSHQFLVKNNIPVRFIADLNLFNDFGESPPLMLNEAELAKVNGYAKEIFELNQSDIAFKYEAIGSLLKLILIQCNNICSLPKAPEQSLAGQSSILSQFKTLIDEHHQTWHTTTEYADALNISPDHLNRVVKMQTGKTAKEHIQSRIIVAAKRYLYFSELSTKEIGYTLGFSEPANFSAFFKNCVGTSPSKFRPQG